VIALSGRARACIAALFRPEDVAQAERRLESCTDDRRLIADVEGQGSDRIQLALIRFSDGSLERLELALDLFRRDWRDLLMASDFADDVRAHETWRPRRLDPATLERWRLGDLPPGVKFGPGIDVEIRFGLNRGKRGLIVVLLGLEPLPRYLIRLPTGDSLEEGEYSLQLPLV
jgi:hypothetical protein